MQFYELDEVLREEFLYDKAEPQRFTPALIERLLKEAEGLACRSGSCKLIHDDTLKITLVAGTSSYSIDAAKDSAPATVGTSILTLEGVIWSAESGDILLEKTSLEALDAFDLDTWRNADAGEPSRYYVKGRTLYLDRAPTAEAVALDATLNLDVHREPKSDSRTAPEIAAKHHYALCYWVAWRCLQRPDVKMFDQALAAQNLTMFERHFGKPVESSTLEYMLESAGHLHVSTGSAYADIYRKASSDWVRDLG